MSGVEVFGFSLVSPMPGRDDATSIEATLDLIRQADDAGLDGWFIAEHHGRSAMSVSSAPGVLLAAAGQRTSKLRLGVMAWVLPFHHPLRLAEEIATLHALLGPRLEVGVGRGHLRDEQAAFGVERPRATQMFDESLEIVQQLLAGQSVDYDSEWWNGSDAAVTPSVDGTIPIWLTAVSPDSVDKAARLGFSCATALLPKAEADARLATYRSAWAAYHPELPPGRFAITASVAVADSRAEAVELTREYVEQRQSHFSRAIVEAPQGDDPSYEGHRGTYETFAEAGFDDMISDGLLIAGNVDECRAQVDDVRARGIDTLICTFVAPSGAPERSLDSMERFARDVLGR